MTAPTRANQEGCWEQAGAAEDGKMLFIKMSAVGDAEFTMSCRNRLISVSGEAETGRLCYGRAVSG